MQISQQVYVDVELPACIKQNQKQEMESENVTECQQLHIHIDSRLQENMLFKKMSSAINLIQWAYFSDKCVSN